MFYLTTFNGHNRSIGPVTQSYCPWSSSSSHTRLFRQQQQLALLGALVAAVNRIRFTVCHRHTKRLQALETVAQLQRYLEMDF